MYTDMVFWCTWHSEQVMCGVWQGCPIGIPKNPEISEADRTGGVVAEKTFTRRARNNASVESAMGSGGGGGGVAIPNQVRTNP